MPTVQEILTHLEVEGYCVIEEVIPLTEVHRVRESVSDALRTEYEAAEARMAAIRVKGHRVGGQGVQVVPGIINLDQSFAPYLTDARIIGAVRTLFGDFHRISNTSGMANHPGNDRGYWHADWPFNQTNAAHIPAPYADTLSKLSSLWMLTEFTPGPARKHDLPEPAWKGLRTLELPQARAGQDKGVLGCVIGQVKVVEQPPAVADGHILEAMHQDLEIAQTSPLCRTHAGGQSVLVHANLSDGVETAGSIYKSKEGAGVATSFFSRGGMCRVVIHRPTVY